MPPDVQEKNPIYQKLLCNFEDPSFYVFWLYGYSIFCFFLSIYIESKSYALKPQQFKVKVDNYDPE